MSAEHVGRVPVGSVSASVFADEHVHGVPLPTYPAPHSTSQLPPAETLVHPETSYADPCELSDAHPTIGVHTSRLPTTLGSTVPSTLSAAQSNDVDDPMKPEAHGTIQLCPAYKLLQPLTSYASPWEESAAHPAVAVHVGRLPAGSVLPSTLSLGQVYVDVSAPV